MILGREAPFGPKIHTKDSRGETRASSVVLPPNRGRPHTTPAPGEHRGDGEADCMGRARQNIRARGRRAAHAGLVAIGLLLSGGIFDGTAAQGSTAPEASTGITHVRGIYRQRAIEIATVGTHVIYLTRMTRFRRCGRFRGVAEDFNDHLVDVAGRDVPGLGFVAGLVNTIEGCARPGGRPSDGPFFYRNTRDNTR